MLTNLARSVAGEGFRIIGIKPAGAANSYEVGQPTAIAPVQVSYGRPGWVAGTPVIAGNQVNNVGEETQAVDYADLRTYTVLSEGICRAPEAVRVDGKLVAYSPRYSEQDEKKLSVDGVAPGMFSGSVYFYPGFSSGPDSISGRLDSTLGKFALDGQQGLFGVSVFYARHDLDGSLDRFTNSIPVIEVLSNGVCLHDPRIPYSQADSYLWVDGTPYYTDKYGVLPKAAIGGVARGFNATLAGAVSYLERSKRISGWKTGNEFFPNDLGDTPDNNPALVVLDYLVDEIYGAGIPLSDIDMQSIVDAANYCDELAPTTAGKPSQNQMACNLVVETENQLLENLQKILPTCRGKLAWVDGVYSLQISKAGESVRAHLKSGVILKRGNLDFGRRKDRINQILGTYIEPNAGYEKRQFRYPPAGSSLDTQWRINEDGGVLYEKKVEFHGCTNAYQAADLAATMIKESRKAISVSYECTLEALEYTVGDIVRVDDPDGLWTNKLFRIVKTVIKLMAGRIVLFLREHSDSCYDNLEKPVLVRDEGILVDANAELNKPLNLQAESGDSTIYVGPDGTILGTIKLSWTANSAAASFDVQYRFTGDTEYVSHPSVDGNSTGVTIRPIESARDYDIRVRARGRGQASVAEWQELLAFHALGKLERPPGVGQVYVDGQNLSWVEPENKPADFAGYVLRYHVGTSQDWDSAQPVHEGLITETHYTVPFPLYDQMVLLLKTMDTTGNFSELPAVVARGFGDIPVKNVVFSKNILTDFAHRYIDAGELQSDGRIFAVANGDFYSDTRADVYDAADFWAPWGHQGVSATYAIDLPVTVKPGEHVFISAGIAGPSQLIEVSWGNFGDTQPAEPWRTIPRVLAAPDVKRRLFVRLSVAGDEAGAERPRIESLSVLVDVPDISEQFDDLAVVGEQVIPIQKQYRVISNLSITLQAAAGGAVGAEIVSKDNLTPKIRCFDINRNTVAGLVDLKIQGY